MSDQRELDPLHAVVSTGAKSKRLPGGRSRRTENNVPILEVHDEHYAALLDAKEKLLDPDRDSELLAGETVRMHTARSREHGGADVVTFHIGGSTLDEAAKECAGAFEDSFSSVAPSWVWSSSPALAKVIGDHYHCDVRDEEPTP